MIKLYLFRRKGVLNRMKRFNLSTVMLMVMIVFSSLMTIAYLETRESHIRFRSNYEELARSNARSILQVLKGQLLDSIKSGEVDPYSDESLSKWASKYLDQIRNLTENSDGFMIELGSERFIFDGSTNCMKKLSGIRTMRDEVVNQPLARGFFRSHNYTIPSTGFITSKELSILPKSDIEKLRGLGAIMHHDYILADKVYNKIRDNYDTRQGDNVYWRFNKSKEYLEWVIVPQPRVGFGGEKTSEYGSRNPRYRGLVIVLGTQEDELLAKMKEVDRGYSVIRILLILASFVIMGGSLVMVRMLSKSACPLGRDQK